MAFVFRDPKRTQGVIETTPINVGPGTYEPPSALRKSRISYAPFSSSSERGTSAEPYDYTPGPGEYTRGFKPEKKLAVSSQAFTSRTQRFSTSGPVDSGAPGPGQYKLKSTFDKAAKRRARSSGGGVPHTQGNVQWIRVESAPSIPAAMQSFGYEENKRGELVLQKPPEQGFTGQGIDTVGPGQYTNNHNTFGTHVVAGTSFGRSRVHRETNKTQATGTAVPGPGVYNPEKVTEFGASLKSKSGRKPMSSFASTTRRWGKARQVVKDEPGPGTYDTHLRGAFESTEYVPPHLQFLGSRVARSNPAQAHAADVPGPGQYTRKSDFDAKDDAAFEAYQAPAVSFLSASQRFVKKKSETPGPGSYADPVKMTHELSKKIFGRNTSFGTTAKRFNGKSTGLPANVPGPGTYTERRLVGINRKTSNFASRSKRFDVKRGKGPDVGTYGGSVVDWKAPGAGDSSAFRNKEDRFHYEVVREAKRVTKNLGPGQYPVESKWKTAAAAGSSFSSGTKRLKEPHRSPAPGPGAYITPDPNSLIKRSFNITVGMVGT